MIDRESAPPLSVSILYLCLTRLLIPVHISAGIHIDRIIFYISELLWLRAKCRGASSLNVSECHRLFREFLAVVVKEGDFDIDRRCACRGIVNLPTHDYASIGLFQFFRDNSEHFL